MKILHAINSLSAGGAELHLLTLCRHLRRAGVEVVVGYLKEGKGSRFLRGDFEREGIRVADLKGERLWDGRCLWRAVQWVRQERPDLVHTHLPRADLVGALVRAAGARVAWVSSVHAIYSRSWRGKWSLPLFALLWRRADAVIAISYAVKDWLVKEHRVPPGKVHVIHYGIEPERFASLGEAKAGEGDRPVIGTIGRLEPVKGHETLVRAMPLVLSRHPQARLRIAGHDPWGYSGSLRRLSESLGLEERVELLGFVEDIPSFLREIDVFAFASRSEGFGQVVIEAMAAKRPVVVSAIPPLTEIVVDKETGLWAKPEDPSSFAEAIIWLLTHRAEAKKMGEKGYQRVVSVFSAQRMTERTLSLYSELAAKR